ncbi:hypothetical protein EpCFBP13511_23930, partial [Erwinia persicina]
TAMHSTGAIISAQPLCGAGLPGARNITAKIPLLPATDQACLHPGCYSEVWLYAGCATLSFRYDDHITVQQATERLTGSVALTTAGQ